MRDFLPVIVVSLFVVAAVLAFSMCVDTHGVWAPGFNPYPDYLHATPVWRRVHLTFEVQLGSFRRWS